MQLELSTDKNIDGGEELTREIEQAVQSRLSRFMSKLTRIEAHVSDGNSWQKGGDSDKQCVLEARPAGLRPVAASHRAESVSLAVDGAAEKLERLLESAFGKLETRAKRQ